VGAICLLFFGWLKVQEGLIASEGTACEVDVTVVL